MNPSRTVWKRVKTTGALCLVGLLIIASLVGCGKAEDDVKPNTAAPGVVATDGGSAVTETLKVGAAISFSGALAREGTSISQGYQLWADYVNANGGIEVDGKKYMIELVLLDDKSDSNTAVKLVEKLITDDKVDFVFGPYGSNMTIAASAVNEKYKTIMIAPMANSADVYSRDYKYIFGLLPPIDFGIGNHINIVDMIADPPKTVAIVYPDEMWPKSTAERLQVLAGEKGLEVVYFASYPKDTKDLSPLVSEVAKHNPDMLLTTGLMEDTVLLVRSFRERDVNIKYFGGVDLFLHEDFLKTMGNDANHLTAHAWWDKGSNNPSDVFGSANKVVDLYKEANGAEPDYYTISGVSTGEVLHMAIKTANSIDTDAVREALLDTTFNTSLMKVKYEPNGSNPSGSGVLIQIQEGAPVVVFPEDLKQADIIYPKPNWE